jgi:hypothetical protein
VFPYRLTKYDPEKRDANGHFTAEEWTSVSDIGRTLGGQMLSVAGYLVTENAYVTSVRTLLSASDITSMLLTDVERRALEPHPLLQDAVFESSRQVTDHQILAGVELENIVRACLREYLWCRLNGPDGAYLHFGYDYYVYVGLPKSASELVLPPHMFWEEFESPYRSLDD